MAWRRYALHVDLIGQLAQFASECNQYIVPVAVGLSVAAIEKCAVRRFH